MSTIFKVADATQEFRKANVFNQMAERRTSYAAGKITGDGTKLLANSLFNRSWIQLVLTTSAGAAEMGLPIANSAGYQAVAFTCDLWSKAGESISDYYGSFSDCWKIQLEHELKTYENDIKNSDRFFEREQQEHDQMRSASDRAIELLAQAFKRQ